MDELSAVSTALLSALKKVHAGDVPGAEADLLSIRRTWFVERSPVLMVDLMVVECACAVYTGNVGLAKDRVRRALVIAELSQRSECTFAASAWSAYISMIEGDTREAADRLVSGCAVRPMNVSPLAEFRFSSILAVLLEYLGSSFAAAQWFERTRNLASRTGLPGSFSSLIYNMAVARVSASMLSRIESLGPTENAELDLLAARSAINFDSIANVHVLDPFHRLVESQALYLCGRIPHALNCIEALLAKPQGVPERFIARAEFEFLRYRLANHEVPAESELEKLVGLLHAFQSDDELALVKYVLADGFAAVGIVDVASRFKDETKSHLRLHKEMAESIFSDFMKAGFLPASSGSAKGF